jgi:hypothetical protein
MDWHTVDPTPLFEAIRERGPASDAERAVWAFERAIAIARMDSELLAHLFVACVCLRAYEENESPRAILEQTFRRSVSDREWRERFAPLIA